MLRLYHNIAKNHLNEKSIFDIIEGMDECDTIYYSEYGDATIHILPEDELMANVKLWTMMYDPDEEDYK